MIHSSTASTGNYSINWNYLKIKDYKKDITVELKKIAEEQEEDKEKHLPIFDIKDLDL